MALPSFSMILLALPSFGCHSILGLEMRQLLKFWTSYLATVTSEKGKKLFL
jgi:hypothetical protein